MIEFLIYLHDDKRVALKGRRRLAGDIIDAKQVPHRGWGRCECPPDFGILAVELKTDPERWRGTGRCVYVNQMLPEEVADLFRGRLELSKERFNKIVGSRKSGDGGR